MVVVAEVIGAVGNSTLSFLLGTIAAEVSRLFALEATPFLHQFGPLLWGHDIVGSGNDIDVHGIRIFLWVESPPWFGFIDVGLWGASV